MKKIETLIEDIENVFANYHEFDEKNVELFGQQLAKIISTRINPDKNREPSLRMSNLGESCNRKLYYSINSPSLGKELPFAARVKFLFGDILEALLLFLAKEAGHSVTGEQDTLTINGVNGHRDAVIDGVTVDCKSASTFSFKKFASGLKEKDDAFGYLTQLNAYIHASKNDPLVTDKKRGAFFVVDKTLGHLCLDIHEASDDNIPALISEKREFLSSDKLPDRELSDVPFGKSGNRCLQMKCSYCAFNKACWPGLRLINYASGPVYFTKVVREPNIGEKHD